MLEMHCCAHEQCGSSVIDVSTPENLQRDFHNWLNGVESSSFDENRQKSAENSAARPASSTDGRKNRKKGTNLYGRPYCPGRPLSMEERTRIIELHSGGMKVNAISKSLCISHGCVSKIISRYRTTGVLLPACSPEQRRSRKRRAADDEQYASNYRIHDANGNEYINERYVSNFSSSPATNLNSLTRNAMIYEYPIQL